MKQKLKNVFVFLVLLSLPGRILAANPPLLITQAHSHNDYTRLHPLFDALDHGFCSVEADIYLVNGALLVAHDRNKVKPERTLSALYLDPLRQRARRNGGHIYPNGPEFTLLIDLKEPWPTLYPALRSVLTNYADLLTTFRDGAKQTNAVLVIITGDCDKAMLNGEKTHFASMDGQLRDLDGNPAAFLVPWISTRWGSRFSWRGTGTMPESELLQLKGIVARAHAQGRRVRFWAAPDNLNCWKTLRGAGVDLINTDNLAGVEKFFSETDLEHIN